MVETENTDKSTPNSNNDKTKEKKKLTFKEKVKFYVTFAAASVGKILDLCFLSLLITLSFELMMIGICTFSLFLFLIPFVIDPAVATINHDFVEDPVQCRVILNQYILGKNLCFYSQDNQASRKIFINSKS